MRLPSVRSCSGDSAHSGPGKSRHAHLVLGRRAGCVRVSGRGRDADDQADDHDRARERARGPHVHAHLRAGGVRNLPNGVLRPLDACRALVARRRDGSTCPRLSTHSRAATTSVAPRKATIAGYRNGRKVRTFVEVGGCERLLVARTTLNRFVDFFDKPTSS